jgi:probable HAF family extracellular repeat protein
MEKRKSQVFLFFISLAFLLLAGSTTSVLGVAQYTITKLDSLGYGESVACDINNSGQIVGFVGNGTSDSSKSIVMWENDKVTDFGISGMIGGLPSINDSGTITGDFTRLSEDDIGSFVYDQGTLTVNRTNTFIYGINNLGHYVGIYYPPDKEFHAFVKKGIEFCDLGKLNSASYSDSWAKDINDSDQIVGTFDDCDTDIYHAFLWENGEMKDLGTLGGNYAQAFAINNSGQIVGSSTNSNNCCHGFLWQDGNMVALEGETAWDINDAGQILCGDKDGLKDGDSSLLYDNGNYYALDDLVLDIGEWTILAGYSINDLGQIVGSGYIDGEWQAFLMTPVPEPLTFIFFVLGSVFAFMRNKPI